MKNPVAILPTVIGKIDYGLFYRRSTKLGSGYLLTVLDLMFTDTVGPIFDCNSCTE